MRTFSVLFGISALVLSTLTTELFAQFDTVVVESKLADGSTNIHPPYLESGPWFNSIAKSTAAPLSGSGARYATTNYATFTVTPTLAVPGGTYSVEVTQNGPASQSGDIIAGISQTGCVGLPTTTTAFQRTNANNWKLVGNFTLEPGVTEPAITFSYVEGTLNTTNGRFYSDSIRFIQQEQVIIESRGSGGILNTNGPYSELNGNWQNSSVKSSAIGLSGGGSRFASTNNPSFKINPSFLQPGGVYSVEVTQPGPASQSEDIIVAISQTGCSGLPATTTAFQRSGANTWKSIGIISLDEGVTSPEITFTYASGTLNSTTGRFYSDATRFMRLDIPPVITAHPESQTVNHGSTVTLTVQASGAPALGYQWLLNGTNLAGATANTLSFAEVQANDAGSYSVVVSNTWGLAISSNAVLAVVFPPVIAQQPSNALVAIGENATFTVEASGDGPFEYQWFFDGAAIDGATGSSYTRFNAQPEDAGPYFVQVSNASGVTTSSNALLRLSNLPFVVHQPEDQVSTLGGTATFTVTASGDEPLSYRWQRDGIELVDGETIYGANTPTLTLSSLAIADAANYNVVVANSFTAVSSSNAVLRLASTEPVFIVESRLPGERQNTAPPYEELEGNWQTSMLKSTAPDVTSGIGSRFATTTNAAFKVMPALQAGRTYVVQVTIGAAASVSADIVVGVTQTHCSGISDSIISFQNDAPNSWKNVGIITLDPGQPMPEITFRYISGTGRFYADAVRFVDSEQPCLAAAVPQIATVIGPLAAGQTFVNVPNLHSNAIVVNVYANGVRIGSTVKSGDGLNVVETTPLVKGDEITATQEDYLGRESCRPVRGMIVGGGANPRIRVSLSIREDTTLTGPVGAPGTSSSGPLKFLGATQPIDGFGTAPLGGKVVEPSSCWQTVSFLRGPDPLDPVDPSYFWFGPAGTGHEINGDYGVLDAIAICIDDLSDSGPYKVYIDDVTNGETVLRDFEGATVGATNVFLMHPAHSGTTLHYLASTQPLANPNVSVVTSNEVDNENNSLMLNWQFRTPAAQSWVRFTTQGSGSPNPIVDLRQPISFRILLLPVGKTNANYVTITNAPVSGSVRINNGVALSVGAIGSGPLSYQWQFNGTNITWATNSQMLLLITRMDQSGEYTAVVRSGCAIATATAFLSVYAVPPEIQSQPQSQAGYIDGKVSFSALVSGDAPMHAQWRFNGDPLPFAALTSIHHPSSWNGPREVSLQLTNLTAAHAGVFDVVITNDGGAITSAPVVLTIRQSSTDYDRDGRPDIIDRRSDGTITLSVLEDMALIRRIPLRPVGTAWRLAAQGDINNDGRSDLLWQKTNGVLGAWLMNGTNITTTLLRDGKPVGGGWVLKAVADLNQDGRNDLLFQNIDRRLALWQMDGTNLIQSMLLNDGLPGGVDWRLAGAGDFTGDGKDDVLWQHRDGRVSIWEMDGTNRVRSIPVRKAALGWRAASTGDFNQDAKLDIVLKQPDGRQAVWLMNHSAFIRTVLVQPPPPPPGGVIIIIR